MGKAFKTSVRVKVWVTAHPLRRQKCQLPDRQAGRRPSYLSRLLTVGMISGAIATAGSGTWLATRLIVDPGSVSWVHWLIPGWTRQSWTAKTWQTHDEIEAEAATAGLIVGEPIYFSIYPGLSQHSAGFHDFLLPLYQAQPGCEAINPPASSPCRLVELRVYRPQTSALRLPGKAAALELVNRLSVTGPEELAAIAPLVNADITSQGSSRRLPLTTVTFVAGQAPLPGIWLHLSGEWQRGSTHTLYGQVVHYDPTRDRLKSLLAWTSPKADFPTWQQVTGGNATELLIDQTIGLEPQFQVYQFAALNTPGKPVQVKPIDLREAMLDNRTYANGLLLARHGLWSTALQVLEKSRKTNAGWSTTAQAQLDLVALHANITQAQAKRDWGNPGKQILALLIDGQWSEALTVLRTAHANGYTTSTLLAEQSDRLWHRVEAAVRVNPQPDVLNWGVLLTAVRQDQTAAMAWLQKQAGGDRQTEQILALLDPLPITTVVVSPPAPPSPVPAAALASTVPVSTASSPSLQTSSRMIGSALPQQAIDPTDWLRPDPAETLALAPGQIWYEIQVIGFQDGQQWQQQGIPDLVLADLVLADLVLDQNRAKTAQLLWSRLGLTEAAQIQLMTWPVSAQPEIQHVTVKAVRVTDSAVWLLATGAPIAALAPGSSVLSMTLATLPGVEPLSTETLASLSQQPGWSETLVPALWQALQQTPALLPASVTHPVALLQEFGGWSMQLTELTGDDQPEAVLTLQTKLASDQAAQTLIFSRRGGLLYSDLSQTGRSLKAITDLGDGNLPALIINNAQSYEIQRWSVPDQQFQ